MDHEHSGKQRRPVLSRRRAFQGLGGGLAATLLGTSSMRSGTAAQQSETRQALSDQSEPQTREFELVAEELDWEIMPGVVTRAWGYNGQTPGPELRVREGDTVRVTLRNRLPVPTTIHWHGIHLRPEMDGPAGLNQAAVAPGDTFVYEFIATPGGTRWYHSHADPALQVPMGLYGPLIVEPRVPVRSYAYDREYTLILGEWDIELTPEVAAGQAERGPRDKQLRGGELGSDMFLLNGHAHGAIPPVRVKEGERVLLRLINAGHLAHPVHLHGHSFKIVATDGNPVPEGMEWTKDTVLIGPAERYDLEVVANNPGVWMLHCHIEHHMANGMMTVMAYEGHQPTGPAAEVFEETMADHTSGSHEEHTSAPAEPTPTPAAASETASTEGEVVITMVDARFEPISIEVPAGTTVTWVNKGADWHNVASSAAGFASDKIRTGESFSFTFDIPGVYRFVCRHHGLAGMTGQITVV
jgi:FtsP/CotA-like multicopper oxidase with cupredoxin domain/plastocyanin